MPPRRLSQETLKSLTRIAGVDTREVSLEQLRPLLEALLEGAGELGELDLGEEEPAFVPRIEGGQA